MKPNLFHCPVDGVLSVFTLRGRLLMMRASRMYQKISKNGKYCWFPGSEDKDVPCFPGSQSTGQPRSTPKKPCPISCQGAEPPSCPAKSDDSFHSGSYSGWQKHAKARNNDDLCQPPATKKHLC